MFGAKKTKAAVFVDFDHWCISMFQKYGAKPDVRAWYDSLCQSYDLREVYFFGDFSNPQLRSVKSDLRAITDNVIDTQNSDGHNEKDYTDFIMLDQLYRKSADRSVKTFVIFSGDGHFSLAARYLKNECQKEVVVYGVKDAISGRLRECASRVIEMPQAEELARCYKRAVYRQISEVYAANKRANLTFRTTASVVAAKVGVDVETISNVMNEMIADGYIYQTKKYVAQGNFLKILKLDSEKIASVGFFE